MTVQPEAHSLLWHGLDLHWGAAAAAEGVLAKPPVFFLCDPGEDALAREVSWMAVDAFEALVAAYPDGPSVDNVRDMWRNLLRSINRHVAEVQLVDLVDSSTDDPAGPPHMRLAGLIMTTVEGDPTWIAFSAGDVRLLDGAGEAIETRDDVGWDMPGYLWTIPMREGQRFVMMSDSLRATITQGRIRSVLSSLVRAERAAAGLLISSASAPPDAAAVVVDVSDPEVRCTLQDSATMVVGEFDEAEDEDIDAGADTASIGGAWGLQLLGITRARQDRTIRRSHQAPPEIEGFRFVSYLGSGGFSDVYLYEEQLPLRMVAIKVMGKRALGTRGSSQFEDEVNTMAQLSGHPSVVTIHSASLSDEGHPYIVMQYCPLPSLSERIFSGQMDLEQALRMGVQISGAVHTAHLMGIHHHDLKPGNVLYSAFGRPLLGDFGIATLAIASASDVMGASVPWAPPEVLAGEPVGRRGDVFSLAATVFTAIAGKPPHGNHRREGELPHFEWIEHPLLETVFRDAMEWDPMLRTASAEDFGNQLREVQKALGFERTPLELPENL